MVLLVDSDLDLVQLVDLEVVLVLEWLIQSPLKRSKTPMVHTGKRVTYYQDVLSEAVRLKDEQLKLLQNQNKKTFTNYRKHGDRSTRCEK